MDLTADQILLRLTSATSQFVDLVKGLAPGSGNESCLGRGLSIVMLVTQPDVPQYTGSGNRVICLLGMLSCSLVASESRLKGFHPDQSLLASPTKVNLASFSTL